uniref:DNA-directed RNA polymerase subunit beta n=1 Tax=Trachydiscus minutus TaxID=1032745 RepID=A0A0D3M5H9_9STRA|nr:plastid-encoded DNA-directed RNA polymerase subunit beta [Trachydiscus minutus]AIB04101.1 plastid-encoded DNA-directed RNA polymerase subunit beta [Trachydiscus minutus]
MDHLFLNFIPDLMEIQKTSFCWFLRSGLIENLDKLSWLANSVENYEIRFFSNEFYFEYPISDILDCRLKQRTYNIRLVIPVEIEDKKLELTHFDELCLCELPLMTPRATFIINGCERTIVGQLVRSPGVYYQLEYRNNKIFKMEATVLANQGSWVYFEMDEENRLWIKTDRIDRIPFPIILSSYSDQQNLIQQLDYHLYFEYLLNFPELYPLDLEDFEEAWSNLSEEIFDETKYNLGKVGRQRLNNRLHLHLPLNTLTLTIRDLIEIPNYMLELRFSFAQSDDIDSLQNRRIRFIGELLQTQISQAISRFSLSLAEKLDFTTTFDLTTITELIYPLPLQSTIDEFFATNPLSQYLDQINPLAELAHKRRVTVLGQGGISNEKTSLAIRDIHPSYYGRLCPIDTPEGENAGLVASLATYTKVNSQGFLESPFFVLKKGQIIDLNYLNAEKENDQLIAMGECRINSLGRVMAKKTGTKLNEEFEISETDYLNFLAFSPLQIFSPAIGLIPFLEHDDANRTLMGAHMQRQAVPLLRPQKPIVGTGIEFQLAIESGFLVIAYAKGRVSSVSSNKIEIQDQFGKVIIYSLEKYITSNQDTSLSHKPIVWIGEDIDQGQVIADGPATDEGELSLGKNIHVAYMPWAGYNYEDAIVVSERLVYENIFTSIHLEKFDCIVEDGDPNSEIVTRDLTGVHPHTIRYLDENGLIYKGAYVQPGDILVGKLTPRKGVDEPYNRLLAAIFGTNALMKEASLRVPLGITGRVMDVKVLTPNLISDLPANTLYLIEVFLAHVRKLQVGDKMSGRHGNKGVVSVIAPRSDLPFLSDGTIIDVILNPLGVPSRMNVGQLFECLLGFAGDKSNSRYKVFPFDEMYQKEASRLLVYNQLYHSVKRPDVWAKDPTAIGKMLLWDGKTGERFENLITVGKPYLLKLIHLVDDKIHARAIGPYSVITQQPLGGRAREGGQRFGEMEVWALEAYGSAHELQELLTLKSDDTKGRMATYSSILWGEKVPKPGVPEAFRVLLRELQALAIDIQTLRFYPTRPRIEPSIKSIKI